MRSRQSFTGGKQARNKCGILAALACTLLLSLVVLPAHADIHFLESNSVRLDMLNMHYLESGSIRLDTRALSVTYSAGDGGSVTGTTLQTVVYGSAGSEVIAVPNTGFRFVKWSDDVPFAARTDTNVTVDISVTAEFAINQYSITFASAGGSVVNAITQDYGTVVAAPADPIRTGYSFMGWNPAMPVTMPAEHLTLTAQWTVNQYTLTFASAGGSAVDAITQDYGTAVAAPADPTRTGYSFMGWDPALPATMPLDGATLTAQWAINQYTLTFDTGAGGSAVDAITQDYGTVVTAPADPTRTGHTFAGWDPAVPATMPAGNLTLTAQWTVNQYTITFASAGGSAVDAITQDYGTAVAAPADPTLIGYSFMGWDPAVPATMPVGDLTLTAQWVINQYAVTFNLAGKGTRTGGGEVEQQITHGTAATAPTVHANPGWLFTGWDAEFANVTANLTVTAQYLQISQDMAAARALSWYNAPGTFDVSITLTWAGDADVTSLALFETVPEGWTFVEVIGENAPIIQPAPGALGTFEFAWLTVPTLPFTFVYRVMVPAGHTGVKSFCGNVRYRTTGSELAAVTAGDLATEPVLYHDADQNQDWLIQLSPELTRIIQFYNSGGYHCQTGTEDGYAPGQGAQSSRPHHADQNGDWRIQLSPELTRLIQFYNSGGYHQAVGTEDGFAPGPAGSRGSHSSLRGGMTAARTFAEDGYAAPGTLDVSVIINWAAADTLTSLAVFETLPPGWTFHSMLAGTPFLAPNAGDSGALEFAWLSIPTFPTTLTYRVNVPAGQIGAKSFSGDVRYRTSGSEIVVTTPATSISDTPPADDNTWSWTISLTGTNWHNVTFGMAPNATADWDDTIDLDTVPPAPHQGGAYFEQLGLTYAKDMRPLVDVEVITEWQLEVQAELDRDLVLSWTVPAAFPAAAFMTLHEVTLVPNGGAHALVPVGDTAINMALVRSLTVPAGEMRTYKLRFGPDVLTDWRLEAGWNLKSLPIQPHDPAVGSVLAAVAGARGASSLRDGTRGAVHTGAVWRWQDGVYLELSSIDALVGAWIFVQEPTVVLVRGLPIDFSGFVLTANWNLVGVPRSMPVPESEELRGRCWRWNAAPQVYEVTSELLPFDAYWLNSRSTVTIPSE